MSDATVWFQPGRGNVGRRTHGLLLGSVLVLTASAGWARGQEVRPNAVAADARPAPLARYVPRPDLLFYLEFDGLDVHAAGWRGSAANKLLNETRLGALLEDLTGQGIELIQQSVPEEKRVKAAEVLGAVKHVARQGFAIGIWGKEPGKRGTVIVARQGDRPEFRRWLQAYAKSAAAEGDDKPRTASIEKAGRTVHPLNQQGWVFWPEKGDLILTQRPQEVLAVIEGKGPSAADHPLRIALAKPDGDFQPAAVAFLDMAALGPLPADAVQLGLDGVKQIELRWGFQDEALMSVLRVVAPAPRRGLLSLLDQPTFGMSSLPPLPSNATGFTVLSIDLAKSYDEIVALVKQSNPGGDADVVNFETRARQRLGLDLRKDLFAHLGTNFVFCAQAPWSPKTGSAADMLVSQVAGFTFSAQVRNKAAVANGIDPLIKAFNTELRQQLRVAARNQRGQAVATLNFRKLNSHLPTYSMDLASLDQPYSSMLGPTVMLGRDQLVLGATEGAVEGALAGGPRWQPAGAFIPVVRRLPAELVYLSLSDPRVATPILTMALPVLVRQINAEIALSERRLGKVPKDVYLRLDPEMIPPSDELNRLLFPSSTALVVDHQGASLTHREAIPTITSPAAGGVVIALLFPAVQSGREAARRAQCINNLKQIALAMHNYVSANSVFPRAAIIDAKGKPILSWRVAILPFIGQQELYNKFKLDEPWDSPHNKALLKEMPPTYLCPNRTKVEPFTTTYQVLVGKGALFEKDQAIEITDVTDGTSNTLMIVEAKEAVPWTKPGDLSFDPQAAASLFGAGSSHPGGFNAAMADGSVRFIKNTVILNVFRALITRSGGEVIRGGSF
ncbi:MAG: DUF1559 domain-containing protein [Isosphaerales bacterium]